MITLDLCLDRISHVVGRIRDYAWEYNISEEEVSEMVAAIPNLYRVLVTNMDNLQEIDSVEPSGEGLLQIVTLRDGERYNVMVDKAGGCYARLGQNPINIVQFDINTPLDILKVGENSEHC